MWRNGGIKFLVEKNGRTLRKTYPNSVFFATKPTWSDRLCCDDYFGEVRRAQLAKFILLTSTLVPLDLFRCCKVCSDAKERVSCGKQREATASIRH